MNRLEFNDFEDFAFEVADAYDAIRDNDDFNDVAIIAKYEEARHIIEELINIGYTIQNIDIKSPEWDYEDEYIISLASIDEGDIWCEPMIKNGDYLEDESAVIYVLDNCSSEVLKHLDSKCIFEVGIGDDECGCDECECTCQKDEKPVTATNTCKESYSINGKSVTKEQFNKKFDELEEKYLDNIRDMLLNHLEFQQEMDEWRRLFRW